jgi:mannose-6-phosphate isomerase-like protein (cupin superfamily)
MHVRRRDDAPRNERGGQVSYLLFATQFGSSELAVTWVRGEPGSQQGLHAHEKSEQVYIIVRGRGLMIVDDGEREVEAGTAVLIPARAEHAIRNIGTEPLEYVSVTTPPFDAEISGDSWEPRYERKPADNERCSPG